MLRRVELAWPVTDPQLRQRIVDECLLASLHDQRDAWDLQADGTYRRARGAEDPRVPAAQEALMNRYAAPPGDAEERPWT
jgi:polyphosphate kinase